MAGLPTVPPAGAVGEQSAMLLKYGPNRLPNYFVKFNEGGAHLTEKPGLKGSKIQQNDV